MSTEPSTTTPAAPAAAPATPAPASNAPDASPPPTFLAGGSPSSAPATSSGPAPGTPATPSEPFYVGLYGHDGRINKSKFDAMPDHLKPFKETFSKYDSIEALLTGTGNLIHLAGKKGLAPLPADAPEPVKAERAALMRQLNGVPDKPEGYGIKRAAEVPEQLWNQPYVDAITAVLHKHGASPDMVKDLLKVDTEHAMSSLKTHEETQAKAQAEQAAQLKADFGAEYDANIERARRVALTAGFDVKDPIFNNAKVVQAFAKIGAMVSEDRLVSGDSKADYGASDKQKAMSIINDPENPLHKAYHDPQNPMNKQAQETAQAFMKRAIAAEQNKR